MRPETRRPRFLLGATSGQKHGFERLSSMDELWPQHPSAYTLKGFRLLLSVKYGIVVSAGASISFNQFNQFIKRY